MKINGIKGANSFWVAYSPNFETIHYGFVDGSSIIETGQPILVAMNYNGFKNFLEAKGIVLSEKEVEHFESVKDSADPALPEVYNREFVPPGLD